MSFGKSKDRKSYLKSFLLIKLFGRLIWLAEIRITVMEQHVALMCPLTQIQITGGDCRPF